MDTYGKRLVAVLIMNGLLQGGGIGLPGTIVAQQPSRPDTSEGRLSAVSETVAILDSAAIPFCEEFQVDTSGYVRHALNDMRVTIQFPPTVQPVSLTHLHAASTGSSWIDSTLLAQIDIWGQEELPGGWLGEVIGDSIVSVSSGRRVAVVRSSRFDRTGRCRTSTGGMSAFAAWGKLRGEFGGGAEVTVVVVSFGGNQWLIIEALGGGSRTRRMLLSALSTLRTG